MDWIPKGLNAPKLFDGGHESIGVMMAFAHVTEVIVGAMEID